MSDTRRATETRSLEEARRELPAGRRRARQILDRVTPRLGSLDNELILDLGCAAGGIIFALRGEGRRALGVEPAVEAIRVAAELSRERREPPPLVGGVGERLPLLDGRCGLVIADSLLEHVDDPVAVFKEVARVLRPGGGFWFYTTSALCPRQAEIRGFPLFGWYPDGLKKRLMRWARDRRPELVGGTRHPAWHWYTPRRVRKLLRHSGFRAVHDRWELRRAEGRLPRTLQRLINAFPPLKTAADILTPDSSYLALK